MVEDGVSAIQRRLQIGHIAKNHMFEDILCDLDLASLFAPHLTVRRRLAAFGPRDRFPRPTSLLFVNHRLRALYELLLSEDGCACFTAECSERDRVLTFTLVPHRAAKTVEEQAGGHRIVPVQLPYVWNVTLQTHSMSIPLARTVPLHALWSHILGVLPSVVDRMHRTSRLTDSVLEAAAVEDAKEAFYFVDDGVRTPEALLDTLLDWGISTSIRRLLGGVCVPMLFGLVQVRNAHRVFVADHKRRAHQTLFANA